MDTDQGDETMNHATAVAFTGRPDRDPLPYSARCDCGHVGMRRASAYEARKDCETHNAFVSVFR